MQDELGTELPNIVAAEMEVMATHAYRLTRKSSAAAGESERGLKWTCFHNLVRGLGAASG
jgi:hypothetical protein